LLLVEFQLLLELVLELVDVLVLLGWVTSESDE
jgi:hypothetical protein